MYPIRDEPLVKRSYISSKKIVFCSLDGTRQYESCNLVWIIGIRFGYVFDKKKLYLIKDM
jgi:hypothetical protein